MAPHAVDRAQIVPGPKPVDDGIEAGESEGASTPAQRRYRLSWAVLLARVFAFELTVCDQCGGNVKIVAACRKYSGRSRPAGAGATDRGGPAPSAARVRHRVRSLGGLKASTT